MHSDTTAQLPEHFLDEGEPLEDSPEPLPECSESDDNFETGPRVDFESPGEPL